MRDSRTPGPPPSLSQLCLPELRAGRTGWSQCVVQNKGAGVNQPRDLRSSPGWVQITDGLLPFRFLLCEMKG